MIALAHHLGEYMRVRRRLGHSSPTPRGFAAVRLRP